MDIKQKIPTPFQLPFFALLICWKWLFIILYKYPLEDIWHQKTLAINFVNGYGVHYLNASVSDLSLWNTETLFRWPPLNAILTGLLTNIIRNVDWAVSILDCVAILILFSAVRSIVALLQLSVKQQWYIWFLFLFNPLLTDLFSTSDLLSLSFWVLSFYFAYSYLLIEKKQSRTLFLLILIGFLPAAFRYQYYPIIFILPISYFFIGFQNRYKKLMYVGAVWAIGMLVLLIAQIMILKSITGGGIPVKDVVEFSPNNLNRITPFFLYSFSPIYLIINMASELLSYDLVFMYQLAGIISLVVFCLYIVQFKKQRIQKPADYFFRILALISVFAVFMLLCILSVYYRKQLHGISSFTYVQEPRYWGIIFILVPLLFVSDKAAITKKSVQWFLTICICFNTIFSIYRLQKTNNIIGSKKMQNKKEILLSIDQAVEKNNRPIIITSFDSDFSMYNSTTSYATVDYNSLLKSGKLMSSKPINFFLITGLKATKEEAIFIGNNQLIFMREINNLYSIYKNQ